MLIGWSFMPIVSFSMCLCLCVWRRLAGCIRNTDHGNSRLKWSLRQINYDTILSKSLPVNVELNGISSGFLVSFSGCSIYDNFYSLGLLRVGLESLRKETMRDEKSTLHLVYFLFFSWKKKDLYWLLVDCEVTNENSHKWKNSLVGNC